MQDSDQTYIVTYNIYLHLIIPPRDFSPIPPLCPDGTFVVHFPSALEIADEFIQTSVLLLSISVCAQYDASAGRKRTLSGVARPESIGVPNAGESILLGDSASMKREANDSDRSS